MKRALALAGVMSVAACGAVPPRDITARAAGDASLDLVYTLTLVRAPFTMVRVDVESRGDASGKTTFDLGPGWAGVEHPEDEVHGFTATAADRGAPLAVSHAAGHTWVVAHAPSARVIATYYLTSARQDIGSGGDSYYRALARDHLVHLIGNNALIAPTHVAADRPRRIGLRWRGFAEAGWRFVSSFGADASVDLDESLDGFRQAVFVASDQLRVTTRKVGRGTLAIGVVGAWPWTDAAFADAAAPIVATERAFFADPGPPFFLITVLPVGAYDPRGASLGGTGLTHSFATFMTPRTPLDAKISWLLGHELFHTWNGSVITPEPPEELAYWLTEGFTNFYARRLLFRAGVVTLADDVANLNEDVLRYRTSPVRDQPNTRIQADFWKSPDVEKLPYVRGDLVALLVDRELRRASHGARSLDDLMKALVTEARAGARVSTDALLARIGQLTTPAFAAALRHTIVDGAPLELPLDLLEPCLSAAASPMAPWDLGFDLERSRAARRIVGVIAGASAEAAGLRDGDALVGLDVVMNDPEVDATVTIERDGVRRSVRYRPRGAPIAVPVFAVHDAKACADLL